VKQTIVIFYDKSGGLYRVQTMMLHVMCCVLSTADNVTPSCTVTEIWWIIGSICAIDRRKCHSNTLVEKIGLNSRNHEHPSIIWCEVYFDILNRPERLTDILIAKAALQCVARPNSGIRFAEAEAGRGPTGKCTGFRSRIYGHHRHCCKAHAKINRKMGNSALCKIVTPENIILR